LNVETFTRPPEIFSTPEIFTHARNLSPARNFYARPKIFRPPEIFSTARNFFTRPKFFPAAENFLSNEQEKNFSKYIACAK